MSLSSRLRELDSFRNLRELHTSSLSDTGLVSRTRSNAGRHSRPQPSTLDFLEKLSSEEIEERVQRKPESRGHLPPVLMVPQTVNLGHLWWLAPSDVDKFSRPPTLPEVQGLAHSLQAGRSDMGGWALQSMNVRRKESASLAPVALQRTHLSHFTGMLERVMLRIPWLLLGLPTQVGVLTHEQNAETPFSPIHRIQKASSAQLRDDRSFVSALSPTSVASPPQLPMPSGDDITGHEGLLTDRKSSVPKLDLAASAASFDPYHRITKENRLLEISVMCHTQLGTVQRSFEVPIECTLAEIICVCVLALQPRRRWFGSSSERFRIASAIIEACPSVPDERFNVTYRDSRPSTVDAQIRTETDWRQIILLAANRDKLFREVVGEDDTVRLKLLPKHIPVQLVIFSRRDWLFRVGESAEENARLPNRNGDNRLLDTDSMNKHRERGICSIFRIGLTCLKECYTLRCLRVWVSVACQSFLKEEEQTLEFKPYREAVDGIVRRCMDWMIGGKPVPDDNIQEREPSSLLRAARNKKDNAKKSWFHFGKPEPENGNNGQGIQQSQKQTIEGKSVLDKVSDSKRAVALYFIECPMRWHVEWRCSCPKTAPAALDGANEAQIDPTSSEILGFDSGLEQASILVFDADRGLYVRGDRTIRLDKCEQCWPNSMEPLPSGDAAEVLEDISSQFRTVDVLGLVASAQASVNAMKSTREGKPSSSDSYHRKPLLQKQTYSEGMQAKPTQSGKVEISTQHEAPGQSFMSPTAAIAPLSPSRTSGHLIGARVPWPWTESAASEVANLYSVGTRQNTEQTRAGHKLLPSVGAVPAEHLTSREIQLRQLPEYLQTRASQLEAHRQGFLLHNAGQSASMVQLLKEQDTRRKAAEFGTVYTKDSSLVSALDRGFGLPVLNSSGEAPSGHRFPGESLGVTNRQYESPFSAPNVSGLKRIQSIHAPNAEQMTSLLGSGQSSTLGRIGRIPSKRVQFNVDSLSK